MHKGNFNDGFNWFTNMFMASVSLALAVYAIYLIRGNVMTQPLPPVVIGILVVAGIFALLALYNGIRMIFAPKDTRLDDLTKAIKELNSNFSNIPDKDVVKTAQNNKSPDHLEDFRTEYQVCQQAADGASLSHWAFAGIFLGLSAVVLGNLIVGIFNIDRVGFKILVTLISIGMIIIYFVLNRLLDRTNERIQRYYDRMRDIEKVTHMQVQTIQQKQIKTLSGRTYLRIITHVLIVFWLIAMGLVWST